MPVIRAREVGSIIESRINLSSAWFALRTTASWSEKAAIKKYARTHDWENERDKGLARCVAFYVEVTDAK